VVVALVFVRLFGCGRCSGRLRCRFNHFSCAQLMPSRFARPAAPCNGGMDVRGAARKQPAFIVWGFPREGQTHSAKNAKPLLTTIHPFLVTLDEPASVREVMRAAFSLVVYT